MITTVYVAGASAEIKRAAGWIDKLSLEGFRVTYDWTEAVSKFGSYGNTLRDHERRMYARSDLRGIAEASIFWLLVPPPGVPTTGAWVELGFALALAGHEFPVKHKRILVSPPVSESMIFATLPAVIEFEDDAKAFEWICKGVT